MINEICQFGFKFGAANVQRLASDDKKGWVYIGVLSPKPKESIHVCVTKTGKTRVYKNGIEIK